MRLAVVRLGLPDKVRGGGLNVFKPCLGPGRCWRAHCSNEARCGDTAPWEEKLVTKEIRAAISEVCPGIDWQIAEGQPSAGAAVSYLLRLLGDPEADWFETMTKEGVDMGILEPMPRTPLVCRQKNRWRLGEWEGPFRTAESNYGSVAGHEREIIAKLEEERLLGRTMGPFKCVEEVAEACGCAASDIIIGKCAFLNLESLETPSGTCRW